MSHVRLVQDLYAAFGRGDVPTVLGAFDPKIEWREAAHELSAIRGHGAVSEGDGDALRLRIHTLRRHSLAFVAASALFTGCVYAPPPTHPVVVSTAPDFDRSWAAGLAAAADVGVQVTLVDRIQGNITGTKDGAAVTIEMRQLPDKSLQMRFSAPDSKEINPKLGERWVSAYNRRMGR